jgi:hypothetical protein
LRQKAKVILRSSSRSLICIIFFDEEERLRMEELVLSWDGDVERMIGLAMRDRT